MLRRIIAVVLIVCASTAQAEEFSAKEWVVAAMDHWRGKTSYGEMTMTIHRPDWQRSMSMRSWSEGDKTSLVRVTAPRKDKGNGTLMKADQMWTYSPKVNRVIKVPSSMMSQSWMGSDLSNNEVSKSTDIIYEYDHRLLEIYELDGHTVYVIEAIPHEDSAVVWGKEILHVRDDHILLEEQFWDQDGELVKIMKAREIREMSGRTVASVMRVHKVESPEQWTELVMESVQFDIELTPNLFTLSNLRNPRE